MRGQQVALLLMMSLVWPSSSGWTEELRASLPAIRQVWLDAKDASAVLGTGSWSMVPRLEFSRILDAARKVDQAERRKPWLLSAQYDARIDGLQMLGTAQLLLHNPHEISGWATLSPWTMPLRRDAEAIDQMKWTAIRSVAERSLGLFIRPQGNQSHQLSWSLQGDERSDGRWFQLQLPSCPQATMNIIVPLPFRLDWPSARQHLRGPFPVQGENARRWQLQLGGEARQDVQLVLRTPFEQRQVSWSEARLDADFVVNGTEVLARYEIDVQRWHDRLRPLLIDLPDQLKIKSLLLRQLDTDVPLPIQKSSATTLSISFPETIEQRATVVLEATWSVRRGERIVFHTPGFRSNLSVKPTLRIVSMPAEPLVDWNWGDYVPQQLTSQEASAEVLTLTPRLMKGSAAMTPPSARQVERTLDLAYQQDTWWNLGKRKQQLTVRCQCVSSQGQNELISWLVPSGWAVKDVTGDASTPIHSWTWQVGRPLEVQWPAGRRAGQKFLVTVHLEPTSPFTITEEPRVWFMPNLIPQTPGRFNGSYALSLERMGELLPPSLVVIKSPGMRASPPLSPASLWSSTVLLPDLYWQLQEAAATGSVQIQDWPSAVRASLMTEILDGEKVSSLKYRMKLQPLAGSVLRWPVSFASPQQEMAWASIPNKHGGIWKQPSPTTGQFTWAEPLESTVELESIQPWTAGTPIPLMTSPMPFVGRLKAGRFWKLPADWAARNQARRLAGGDAEWAFEGKASPPDMERLFTNRLEMNAPRMDVSIHGSVAEITYNTTVPAHQETFQLTLPPEGEAISCEIDGRLQRTQNPVTLPASLRPLRLLLKYRSRVHDGLLVSEWKPVVPAWNVETNPAPMCFVTLAPHHVSLSGSFSSSEHITAGHSIVWVSRPLIVVIAAFFVGLCWWLLRHRSPWRRRVTVASISILAIAGSCLSVLAQGERTSLVYILRGDAGKEDDERVMVPASLWQQMQAMAKQTAAGANQRWWVSEVNTEGQLQEGRLRLKSKWSFFVNTVDSAGIPWPDSRPPEEVTIDEQPVQPRLVSGPFGLQQWVIPVQRPGTHEMVLTWVLPVKEDSAFKSVELINPGAPSQKLTIKGVSDKLFLQGTTGAWQINKKEGAGILTADTGLSHSLALSWPSPNLVPPDVTVDVGVLWEHRVHQSMAHAVLAYHMGQGTLDQFAIDLPAGLRVRNLSLVGEVQAAVTPRIKKWRIEQAEGKQQLQVNLHRPVAGTVYLLLELLWQREVQTDTVPLEHVHPVGVTQRHGIVAYLADGVQVEPLSPLQPATSDEIDFARPWLPSLGLLPASAIAKAPSSQTKVVLLRLQALSSLPLLTTESSITMEPQGVLYRFTVDAKAQQRPLVYLNGSVDPGLVINEVVGKQVSRWFQTLARPGEPSRLSIWFNTGNGATQDTSFTVNARQPAEWIEGQRIRLPVYQIRWDGTIPGPPSLRLLSNRSEKVIGIQPSDALREIPGPWNDRELLTTYEIPQTLPTGTTILFQEENAQQLPHSHASWDSTLGEPRWVLTITAPSGAMLPAQIDMLMLNGQLEQNWKFEASVPLVFRPSRSSGNAILWSMQLSKPVNKVQIKCYPLRDAQGKAIQPTVSFPAWPGMVITPAE